MDLNAKSRPAGGIKFPGCWLLLAAAAVLFAGCGRGLLRSAPGGDGEVVEVEGWAPLEAADELGTKRRALADAQKKAVERVLGVYISAKTRVDHALNVDQRILANVDGYIRKYQILAEREEGGFLKILIRALVLYKKVGEDLKLLGLTRPGAPPGNPRVAVLLRVQKGRRGEEAAKGLRAALLAHGLSVVDAKGADLVVRGEAEVHAVENTVMPSFRTARARASVEVWKPETGEVVSTQSREASMIDPSAEVAAGKALETVGNLLGESLVRDLAPLLESRIGVAVRIRGLKGLEQVRQIADDIRVNPGVAAVTLSDYRQGLADLQVTTDRISGGDLAALIVRGGKSRLSAVSVTAYSVELEVR